MHQRLLARILALISTATLVCQTALASGPVTSSDTTPGAMGSPQALLHWSAEEKVAGFPAIDTLFPTRPIAGSVKTRELPEQLLDLSDFTYEFNDKSWDLDSHMLAQPTAGILVVHNGNIVVEQYGLDHGAKHPWVSFSVTKSVVSLLYGAALKDGFISSLDAPITDYLPEFENTSYAGVSIKDILQMASGVAWNEDYADRQSNIANLPMEQSEGFAYMGRLPRVAPAGQRFNYNTGETNIAGAILRKAIGGNLSDYAAAKLFQPAGLSDNAYWMLDTPGGDEFAGCCISATLRDYARIGLFALDHSSGAVEDSPFLPGWLQESTSPSRGSDGYGYFWWLFGDGVYAAEGIFGQIILIDPKRNLVIALQSSWQDAWSDTSESQTMTLFQALADYVMQPRQ
ncbi:MAG: serine hydrolase [Gammaproteobacteria bacterium]|jgi:CubicO group peptidase (beta-lactamase class C family)